MYATATTLMILAAMSVVSGAVSAYGAYSSSQAQADSAKYNAAVARNNAGAAAQQAQFDAQQIRDKNKRILAQQRNAYGANGFTIDSGSAADVASDSALQGELQALMSIYTGKTSATAAEAQAKLFNMNAQHAETAGYIGVAGSLLGGATNAGAFMANPAFSK